MRCRVGGTLPPACLTAWECIPSRCCRHSTIATRGGAGRGGVGLLLLSRRVYLSPPMQIPSYLSGESANEA